MRILLVNDSYFVKSLRDLGCELFYASPDTLADFQYELNTITIEQILSHCPFKPDILLFSDSLNLRSVPLGLERVQIPKVFFGIDSPMNKFWQFDFALGFDLAFLDQKAVVDEICKLHPQESERIHWMPLAADHNLYYPQKEDTLYDIAFVGSLNPAVRPKRSWLLQELQRHFSVEIFDGEGHRSLPPNAVRSIYNQSKIVLNENMFPGLNLRTLEIMACGTCLLTEESDGSWREFFKDGKHLVSFRPENLIRNVETLLNDDSKRKQIADEGAKIIKEKHTIDKRAEQFMQIVQECLPDINNTVDTHRSYHFGKSFLQLANRWPDQPVGKLKDEGVRLLLDATSSKNDSADLHFELAAQAMEDDKPQDALESLKKALDCDPSCLRAHWGMFWCQKMLADYESAADALQSLCHHLRISDYDPDYLGQLAKTEEFLASDYLYLADLMEEAGWLLENGINRSGSHPCRWNAFDALQMAIVVSPKTWTALTHCADLLQRCNSPDFAIIVLGKAVELQPWNPELRLKFAKMLLSSYCRKEGMEMLVQFLTKSNDPAKWEAIEEIPISDDEKQLLLDDVHNQSRNFDFSPEAIAKNSTTRRRVLFNQS
ncbi:hypothetical protein CEE37_08085 [candidate division LCP-89 bacterium B3_LCP]|uniref:Spore protein YkvP/CgeB glycosyl transferase-like domain-containing protein n=1 Tax=candidate division LCP-89 bacterium B3_LCP TaxID=2012998 RepID=A0A532UZA8_UNCL8|nr:MAG: hypothetical protein CEE37_08085 [candidate division LCP-89 bacterium B3_LCP]